MGLSYYINLILELEYSEKISDQDSFCIDGFDSSIILLDDIFDKSQMRDGQPCFYLTYGVDATKKEAKKRYNKSFCTINALCKQRKVGFLKRFYILFLLRVLFRKIQKGQSIDMYLETRSGVKKVFLKKYDRMISLFTGSHIKYSFLIGFLLSGSKASYRKSVVLIGKKIGLLRQIADDIKDYDGNHHEPFGDLVQHKKRIPELFFMLSSSCEEKERLDTLLKDVKKNQVEIRNLVLNSRVTELLLEKKSLITSEMNFYMNNVPDRYKDALLQLSSEFLS